jgi:hypothetical protein
MYTMGTKKKERWVLNPNDLYEVDTAQVRIGYPSFTFFCSHSVQSEYNGNFTASGEFFIFLFFFCGA